MFALRIAFRVFVPFVYLRHSLKMLPSRCFNCAEKGHMSKQCPRPQSLMCYNCQESGHISLKCPVGKYCHSCGDPNHLVSVCPIRGPVCFRCGTKGHLARQCAPPVDDPMSNISSIVSTLLSDRCCFSCGACSHAEMCCQIGH